MAKISKTLNFHGHLDLTASVWKEENLYVAKCKELKVASQGKTAAKALANLEEAIELYLEDEDIGKIILPLKLSFDLPVSIGVK